MIILAIDTTTSSSSLAISIDGRIIYHDYFALKHSHSETILPRIDESLKLLKINKNELSGICVSLGPGSFTGCRIGLATAKGICTGLKIPLIAFNSLDILASNLYGVNQKIISVLDARMSEVYMAIYDGFLNIEIEPHCRPYVAITEGLKGDYVCVGDVHLLPLEDLPADIKIVSCLPHQNLLSASALLSLAMYKERNYTYDEEYISALEPYYIRNVVNK